MNAKNKKGTQAQTHLLHARVIYSGNNDHLLREAYRFIAKKLLNRKEPLFCERRFTSG